MEELLALRTLLQGHRFPLHQEKATQEAIEAVLENQPGVTFTREHRLSPEDIIDFVVAPGIGVEVKLKGSPINIYRQCARYCLHEQISSLLVVTAKALALPPTLHQKPVRVLCLGAGWL